MDSVSSRVFTILVTNLPEAPVGITLDNNTVEENLKKGTIVGNLAAIDEDAGEKHTFKLVDAQSGSANDNALFAISGSSLKTNTAFDYETKSGYTIHVEVTVPEQADPCTGPCHRCAGCQ